MTSDGGDEATGGLLEVMERHRIAGVSWCSVARCSVVVGWEVRHEEASSGLLVTTSH